MSAALFAHLTGAQARTLRPDEPRNGLIHIAALSLTRTADALIDPKLALPWLLTALGAPTAMIGALVPIREAGALLPQLALAPRVEASPQRKRFWAAGAALQGIAALAMAGAALALSGWVAGAAILALLALLACARAASSVSYKDALARSIAKTRRGAVTGTAGSLAALIAFLAGLALASGLFDRAVGTLATMIAAAGAAFLIAALVFLRLREAGRDAPQDADRRGALLAPLRDDVQLRRFIAARAVLTVTALAPPFIVMLSAAQARSALDQLGPLVMASTAASVLGGYVWGRLSDRSSRQTLIASGALAAVAFCAIGLTGLRLVGLGGAVGASLALFAAQIAYQGVRAGRTLHLTDMTDDANRARYTALSNSVIGVVLLAGGGFGLLAERAGPAVVLLLFSALAALGAALATRLNEVQR